MRNLATSIALILFLTGDVFSGGIVTSGIVSGQITLTVGTCPDGYTEYTGARGLYLVGVPSGGTIAGKVGNAMTNQQNITHAHTVSSTTATNASVIGAGVYVSNVVSYTGNANTGDFAPYIQMRLCQKD